MSYDTLSATKFYPGQIIYQDLVEVKTLEAASGQKVQRGSLYTVNADGKLVNPTVASGNDTKFPHGIFQALQTINDNGDGTVANTAGEEKVQVACFRSRITMKAQANVVIGEAVKLKRNEEINQSVVPALDSAQAQSVIGTVFEIANKPGVYKTAENDIVVVDFGWGYNTK